MIVEALPWLLIKQMPQCLYQNDYDPPSSLRHFRPEGLKILIIHTHFRDGKRAWHIIGSHGLAPVKMLHNIHSTFSLVESETTICLTYVAS